MDSGLPCDDCGDPTFMHCHVDGVPTTCRECDMCREEWEAERQEDERRQLEDRAIEEHFTRHPHG